MKKIDRKRWACIAALVVITFAVFAHTISNGFVSDDNRQIIGNPWITDLSHLKDIFTSHSFGFLKTDAVITYRPMVFVVYMAEYFLFGLETWGWHLVSVVLQALVAVAAYLVASRLLGGTEDEAEGTSAWLPPFAAALVFSIHPINSEVVAWVGCQPEQLYTLLCLVAFYVHMRAADAVGGREAWGGKATVAALAGHFIPPVLFFTAVLFKETAVALPVIIFICDRFNERGRPLFTINNVMRYAPYFAAGVIYLVIRSNALGFVTPPLGYNHYLELSTFQVFLNAVELFIHYMRSLVVPLGDYPFQVFDPVYSVGEPRAFIPLIALALMPVAAFFGGRAAGSFRVVILALAIILLPLLPSLYALGINQSPYATRYAYFSSVGSSLLIGLALRSGLRRGGGAPASRRAAVAIFAVLAVVYGVWASYRGIIWRDEPTMWEFSIKGSPDNYIAIYSLAMIDIHEGRPFEGIEKLKEARRANLKKERPDPTMLAMTDKRLGIAYMDQGMTDEAIAAFSEFVYIVPDDIKVTYNLAGLYKNKGLYGEAIKVYTGALEYAEEDWQFKDIYTNIAESYEAMGRWPEAAGSYQAALRYAPGDPYLLRAMRRAAAMAGAKR